MTTVEQERQRFEGMLRSNPADTAAALDLAQLCIEPLHREDVADRLALEVLARESGQPRAVLLHSYVCLHTWIIDEKVAEAAEMLTDIVDRGEEVGAAAVLLDEARGRLRPASGGDIALLRLSVSAEPSWSVNHLRLGRALHAVGDSAGALREFDAAIANLFDAGVHLDPVAASFHDGSSNLIGV